MRLVDYLISSPLNIYNGENRLSYRPRTETELWLERGCVWYVGSIDRVLNEKEIKKP